MECKKVRPYDRKELTKREYEKRLIDANILLPGEQYRYFDKWIDDKKREWNLYGYFVTNYGRVITDNGQRKIKAFKEERKPDKNGYSVWLFTGEVENKKGVLKIRSHKLVSTIFDITEIKLRDDADTCHIHHIDNNKLNNRADNLLKIDGQTHELLHKMAKALGTDTIEAVWQVAEKSLYYLKAKIDGQTERMKTVSLKANPLRIEVIFKSITVQFYFNNGGFDIKENK